MLSVVIPTHESERALVRTLACLVPGATEGLVREVILADAGSSDETAAVGDVAGCRFMPVPGPLGARLSAAAASARASWLMFLRPGTVLDSGWLRATDDFLAGQAEEGMRAATFRPASSGRQPMLQEALSLALAALFRPFDPDRGLIVHKRLYARLGGHRADAGDAEADLLRRIGAARVTVLRAWASTIS
jgi:glycosyltransferase involved in cell wall biosynthesis